MELLHEQGGKIRKFPDYIKGLAYELKQDEATLTDLIVSARDDFDLLKEDDKYIWSERVLRNVEELELYRLQKAESGRLGGIISGIKRHKKKQNEALVEANEAKESKVKEINIQDIRLVVNKFIEVKRWGKDNPSLLTDIYKRNGRISKSLIDIAGGAEKACEVIENLAREFDKKDLKWTLETVVKWYPEFNKKPKIERGDA